MRRATSRRLALFSLFALVAALRACSVHASISVGSSGLDAGKMERFVKAITTRQGLTARRVVCPSGVGLKKGRVSYCTADYADGESARFFVRQSDNNGHVDVAPAEMTEPAVEHFIVGAFRRRAIVVAASCPVHVPIVVGNTFTCMVRDRTQAVALSVKITDPSGGYVLGTTRPLK